MDERLKMKKAHTLEEMDQALQFNVPINPEHPFYVDLNDLRGDFQERQIYRKLNAILKNGVYTFNPEINGANKSLLFLAGMPGSGKSTELEKYYRVLNRPDCFFCVNCRLSQELDMNDLDYMDILMLQLGNLSKRLDDAGIRPDDGVIASMNKWFQDRVTEMKTGYKGELGFELGAKVETPDLWGSLIKLFGGLKIGISGTRERNTVIRETLRRNFIDFALKFNEFIEETNLVLRRNDLGQEILFIIDDLEKTTTEELRRKIIISDANRIQRIKAYTIFVLPAELLIERDLLSNFASVVSFPFVKVVDRGGERKPETVERLKELVARRIDLSLFESEEMLNDAVYYSGGSPRQLLQIIEQAAFFADETAGKISVTALNKAMDRLGNERARNLTPPQLEKLKELKECNKNSLDSPYDAVIQELLLRNGIFEYNDGTYKRVNPLLERTNLYKQRIG